MTLIYFFLLLKRLKKDIIILKIIILYSWTWAEHTKLNFFGGIQMTRESTNISLCDNTVINDGRDETKDIVFTLKNIYLHEIYWEQHYNQKVAHYRIHNSFVIASFNDVIKSLLICAWKIRQGLQELVVPIQILNFYQLDWYTIVENTRCKLEKEKKKICYRQR